MASMAERLDGDPRKRLDDCPPRMAKADLKNLDAFWKVHVGKVIKRACELAGVSRKEAAALCDRDEAQIARWVSGAERPQIDVFLKADRLRQPLIQAFAELGGDGIEVETIVRLRRRA